MAGIAAGLRALPPLAGLVALCAEHRHQVEAAVKPVAVTEIVYVHTASPAVVYYVGDPPSQCVKIGTTTRLMARLGAIRERFPQARLLAVEPGHYALERQRHAQFRELAVVQRGQREWFRKAPALMNHVNAVRAEWGDPDLYRPTSAAAHGLANPPAGNPPDRHASPTRAIPPHQTRPAGRAPAIGAIRGVAGTGEAPRRVRPSGSD